MLKHFKIDQYCWNSVLISTLQRFYQLAFVTPGILPNEAMSRNLIREIPK